MKKLVLTVLAIATIQFAQAQGQAMSNAQPVVKKEAATPEQIAERQSNHLQKVLTLTDEQKQRVYAAVAKRATTVQQLKSTNTDDNALKASIKPVNEQFIKDVNATLTPEQQKKWDEFRAQEQQKKEARMKEQNNATTQPATGGQK